MAQRNNRFITPFIQYANNSLREQLRSNSGDTSSSSWNYTRRMPFLQEEESRESNFPSSGDRRMYRPQQRVPQSSPRQISDPSHFPSREDRRMNRPQQRSPQPSSRQVRARLRFLPLEEVAMLEMIPVMQQHTDDLSYEELLALEEQIGNVNSGLSEGTILKSLSTRVHSLASSPLDHSSKMDQGNSICIICQAEYEENDNIGTLGCRHDYHLDCIKQWLLSKNVCPICKRPAVSTDN